MIKATQTDIIQMVLEKLFESQREEWKESLSPAEFEQRQHDFVFHMTDWKVDLERLALWFKNPESQDEKSATTMLIGFLYHIVPHLNAATRLLLDDAEDPFEADDGQASRR